ncbi:hypothetical protein AMELA_G00070080 [Ameiurus melas]|uniref:Uncharacterized protein n=1 Tax=Ameiurus melas TaxID=219545 RepID=A0A7J6B410_AMEME|nr:hypothetical protein AMELA_G00070080 [Ameiurus melas]
MERRGLCCEFITTHRIPRATLRGRWAGPVDHERTDWAGRFDDPAHFFTTNDRGSPSTLNQEDRTVLSSIPSTLNQGDRTVLSSIPSTISSTGVSLPRITDKDFFITCLTRQIEYLHVSKGLTAPKKAPSARSVDSVHGPAICCDGPGSAKVLRHHHNNKLRMLTHRWKRLGLQDPVSSSSSNRSDHTPEQSQRTNRLALKADSLLKIIPMKASQAAVQRDNEETNRVSSNSSEVGLSEGKVSDSLANASGSSECHTDRDLSDQEQESIDMSKWAAAIDLDLKPEPFDEDLDHHYTETAFYPEVLPASLTVLDSTQNPCSEIQQSLFVTDPCLGPVIARLTELERLQAATVQKERAKLARSRPTTATTRNGNRSRKSNLPGCNTGVSMDVTCSFTELMICPKSSCRCRRHTCSSTKPDQGSRNKLPHPTSPKRPDSMSGKCKKAEAVISNSPVIMKVQQKPTVLNRTKSPKTQKGSILAKQATVPNRKT